MNILGRKVISFLSNYFILGSIRIVGEKGLDFNKLIFCGIYRFICLGLG